MLMTKILERDQGDEFGSMDALNILKNQITSRISQLQSIVDVNVLNTMGHKASNTRLATSNNKTDTLENVSLQLFHSIIAEIETSLLKNLRIRMSEVPATTQNYNVQLINRDEIRQLEHHLQLLNFKGSSDLRERNKCLSKLNTLYYSEMIMCHNAVKDVVSVIKDVESGMQNNKRWSKIDAITDDTTVDIIGDLQQKISSLERDKLHMENEIVVLKERSNSELEVTKRHRLDAELSIQHDVANERERLRERRTSNEVNIQSDYDDDDNDNGEENEEDEEHHL